ncbi:hypothetical protein LJG11_28865, partial [Pseudomonas aeruginosa]|nr:hypothetical protein [Pseudomonas aeruginosa]
TAGELQRRRLPTLRGRSRAALPMLEARRRAALYELALLSGRSPRQLDAPAATCAGIPQLRRALPTGDGWSLLARRPDVRAARQQAPAVAGGQGTAQLRYAGAGRGRSVQLARRAPAEQRQFVECRAPPRLEHRQRGPAPPAQRRQPASLQLAGS